MREMAPYKVDKSEVPQLELATNKVSNALARKGSNHVVAGIISWNGIGNDFLNPKPLAIGLFIPAPFL